jgi:26S proteasome regulatory subunit N7
LLADLTKNLYDSHYDKFFIALGRTSFVLLVALRLIPTPAAELEQTVLLPSRLLAQHTRYYVREMRVLAYGQLLESYASLTLSALANAFGVSVEFVDGELARLVAADRLPCTIDRVHGVVATTRPGRRAAQYDTVVRQGDVVLNAVQRLSKVLY